MLVLQQAGKTEHRNRVEHRARGSGSRRHSGLGLAASCPCARQLPRHPPPYFLSMGEPRALCASSPGPSDGLGFRSGASRLGLLRPRRPGVMGLISGGSWCPRKAVVRFPPRHHPPASPAQQGRPSQGPGPASSGETRVGRGGCPADSALLSGAVGERPGSRDSRCCARPLRLGAGAHGGPLGPAAGQPAVGRGRHSAAAVRVKGRGHSQASRAAGATLAGGAGLLGRRPSRTAGRHSGVRGSPRPGRVGRGPQRARDPHVSGAPSSCADETRAGRSGPQGPACRRAPGGLLCGRGQPWPSPDGTPPRPHASVSPSAPRDTACSTAELWGADEGLTGDPYSPGRQCQPVGRPTREMKQEKRGEKVVAGVRRWVGADPCHRDGHLSPPRADLGAVLPSPTPRGSWGLAADRVRVSARRDGARGCQGLRPEEERHHWPVGRERLRDAPRACPLGGAGGLVSGLEPPRQGRCPASQGGESHLSPGGHGPLSLCLVSDRRRTP